MKKFLAILVCKFGRAVGKLVGKGSSMPGKFALKICPDILARVRLPQHVIAVTGSNGKTSTVEMIAAILRAGGKTVVYNEEGSNQIEGVTTTVLTHASLTGAVRADVLLIESDERYAAQSFRYFHPTEFVITNLYRDQLTRNGHPEWVYDAILPAIHPETELILNADDPLSSCFARGHEKVKWFGLDRCPSDTDAPTGAYRDGAYCPVCRAPMEYDYVHYNHIGAFRCTKCGHRKPATDYTATALDLERGTLTIDGSVTIQLAFRSIYNVYNVLAAYAACRECGVASDTAAGVINNYILKNGRMQKFTLGAHRGMLLTSKHENSIAYDTNLRYIRAAQEPLHRAGDRGRGEPEVLHQRDQLAVGHRLQPAERPPGAAGDPLRPVLQRPGGAVLLHGHSLGKGHGPAGHPRRGGGAEGGGQRGSLRGHLLLGPGQDPLPGGKGGVRTWN